MAWHIEGEQRLGGNLVRDLDGDEVRRLAGLLQMAGEVARHPQSDEVAQFSDLHLWLHWRGPGRRLVVYVQGGRATAKEGAY